MLAAMDLLTYISDATRLDDLCKRMKTSPAYLRQIATKFRGRTCGPKFALRIESETGGIVPRFSLRPDIWPEPRQMRGDDFSDQAAA